MSPLPKYPGLANSRVQVRLAGRVGAGNTELSITGIADRSGYREQEYLGYAFRRKLRFTPAAYRLNVRTFATFEVSDLVQVAAMHAVCCDGTLAAMEQNPTRLATNAPPTCGVPAQTPLNRKERALRFQFGATIREQRRKSGLTQEALASRAGMHRTYLADVERGKRNVALTKIARMAAALDLSLADFYREMERMPAPSKTARR